METFKLRTDRHIGLLFQPRSGSHVLRAYLTELTGWQDLGEFLNTGVVHLDVDVGNDGFTFVDPPNRGQPVPNLTSDKKRIISGNNLDTLQKMSDTGTHTIFGMPLHEIDVYPNLPNILASRQDTQWIYLLRADVLYSLISVTMCIKTEHWHNLSSTAGIRESEPFPILISGLEIELNKYIKSLEDVKQNFNNIDILYYEEFQFNINSLMKRFEGFPKKIISIPWSKFQGNHKDFISNIDEVEDFYEQFVNEHKEYFPQYFGKLPGVVIPACQGRQPRDLSLKLSASAA